MYIQQEHLPRPEDATADQEWGFTFWEFIEGNWIYLLLILIVLIVFLYSRYNWRKRHKKK